MDLGNIGIMGRPKDEYYWNQVDREEDGGLKCKHCGLKFKGGVSRIKAHIDLIEGKGIRICPTSPKCITSSDHSHQDINAITLSQGTTSFYFSFTLISYLNVQCFFNFCQAY